MMLLLCALVAGSSSVWADDTYTKVTSVDDLEAGAEYILLETSTTTKYLANNTYSSSKYGSVTAGFTINGNDVTVTTGTAALVLRLGGSTGSWTLYDISAKQWVGKAESNTNLARSNAATAPTENNGYYWTIKTKDEELAVYSNYKSSGKDHTGRYLGRNSSSIGPYDGSSYPACVLYKKVKPNPIVTFNNGSTNVGKTLDLNTLFSSNSNGEVTYSILEGESYATINGSTITGIAEGSVVVQASQAETSNYNAKTVTATITINAAKTLSSIAITTAPTKTTYNEGELFDATGMVVTATYSDTSTDDVTAFCTWTPDGALTTSDVEITVSYTENSTTKTTIQAITVNAYVQPTIVSINLSNTLFGISAGNNANEQSKSVENVTITTGCESSASSKTYYASDHIRFYADSYLILQAPIGYVITGVSLNRYNDDTWNGNKVTPTTGAFNGTPTASTAPLEWNGIATTVRFDYSGQCRTASVDVTLAKVENVTITAATWASFSCDKALDFTGTGVTAYIAKVKDDSNVTLTEITKVPANTGIVVNAPAETYAIPVLSGDADDTTGNLLKPWLTAGEPTETTYYTLAVSGGEPVFYTSTGGELAANKAYLVMPGNSTAPSLGVFFGGTTGVNDVRSKTEEVRSDFYNLNGQRVAQPTKGLYIVNGKKYIVK